MADRWTEDLGPCPCGKGKRVLHVREDDHPWIANWHRDESIEIECAECGPKPPTERRILSQTQIDRLNAITTERGALDRDLEEIRRTVVNRSFPSAQYPTRKAEWQELSKQKLFSESYAVYCKRRHSCVYDALRHRVGNDWVLKHCDPAERTRVEALIANLLRLDAEERTIQQSPALVIPIPVVP